MAGMEVPIIERAFQLASECGSVAELRQRLRREGYYSVDQHLGGPSIRKQLGGLLDPVLKDAHDTPRGASRAGPAAAKPREKATL
jgi:hypothetical protein